MQAIAFCSATYVCLAASNSLAACYMCMNGMYSSWQSIAAQKGIPAMDYLHVNSLSLNAHMLWHTDYEWHTLKVYGTMYRW